MNTIISINNLSYSYNKREIFSNFNLQIEEGSWVTIAGANSSGKTTLAKIISNTIETNSVSYRIKNPRKEIGIIFENQKENFMSDTVKDELLLSLNNTNFSNIKIEQKLEDISDLLNISDIMDRDPVSLSSGELNKLLIGSMLMYNPKILILDNILSTLSSQEREETLKIIRRYKKDNNLTIINFTTNLEDSFGANRLIIIDKGMIVLDDSPLKVMERDKIISRLGLELPFTIDLSSKLKLYGLVDNLYKDIDKLVFEIWK